VRLIVLCSGRADRHRARVVLAAGAEPIRNERRGNALATYTVIVYEAEGGGYYTEVPAFDTGAEGETIEDALARTRDTITEAIAAMIERGEVIPLADHGAIAAVAQIETDITMADAG
jgi:predicted RNase H-like HicB family nuclease